MDAVEFIRERNRMCQRFDKSCDGCPAYENGWLCDADAWDEKLVAIVEQWSKEHPRKTRQGVFLEQWPDCPMDDDDVVGTCPRNVDKNYICGVDSFRGCPDCRREFWMQEVE